MVKRQKVKQLIHQITHANYVEIMGECPDVNVEWDGDVTGSPDNQILLLTWKSELFNYSVILTEGGLSEARKDSGGNLIVDDHEGNETLIRLWERKQIDVVFNEN